MERKTLQQVVGQYTSACSTQDFSGQTCVQLWSLRLVYKPASHLCAIQKEEVPETKSSE